MLMKSGLRGVTVLGIAAAALAAAAPAAGATSVPDASCDANLGASIVQPNGDLKVAQTFAALHTGGLETASTAVTTPMGATPGDWRLEIAATSGGAPAQVLASTTVPNTLAPNTQGTITGTFASPAAVTAGGTYAVLISRPGSNGFDVAEQGGDPCPGQGYYQNVVSGPFIAFNFVDFRFATTVRLPEPGTSATGKRCKKKKHKKHAVVAKKHKKCKKKKRK
jgi:hypothetical protein